MHRNHVAILVTACGITLITLIALLIAFAGPLSPKVAVQLFKSLLTTTSRNAQADEEVIFEDGGASEELIPTDAPIPEQEPEAVPVDTEPISEEAPPEAVLEIDESTPVEPTSILETEPIVAPTPEPEPEQSWGTNLDIPVATEPVDEVPQEQAPIDPYAEVRSTLEVEISKFDWLYTLRSGADYEAISLGREAAKTDFNQVIEFFEQAASNESLNDAICLAKADLISLRSLLAPGSDESQLEVDSQNEDTLTDIETGLTAVTTIWTSNTQQNLACN